MTEQEFDKLEWQFNCRIDAGDIILRFISERQYQTYTVAQK